MNLNRVADPVVEADQAEAALDVADRAAGVREAVDTAIVKVVVVVVATAAEVAVREETINGAVHRKEVDTVSLQDSSSVHDLSSATQTIVPLRCRQFRLGRPLDKSHWRRC